MGSKTLVRSHTSIQTYRKDACVCTVGSKNIPPPKKKKKKLVSYDNDDSVLWQRLRTLGTFLGNAAHVCLVHLQNTASNSDARFRVHLDSDSGSDSRKIQMSDSGSDSDSSKKPIDSIPIPIPATKRWLRFRFRFQRVNILPWFWTVIQ